jgi:hypothetical protein
MICLLILFFEERKRECPWIVARKRTSVPHMGAAAEQLSSAPEITGARQIIGRECRRNALDHQ